MTTTTPTETKLVLLDGDLLTELIEEVPVDVPAPRLD